MKSATVFACILAPFISLAQSNSGTIALSDSITLSWTIKVFIQKEHQISYCNDGYQKYLCKIDNKEWFGDERSEALPVNQLVKLALKIGNRSYNLLTTKMFNPNFSGQLYKHQFNIKKYDKYYMLYSFFSDGAGTYIARWKIFNDRAVRVLISNKEEDF